MHPICLSKADATHRPLAQTFVCADILSDAGTLFPAGSKPLRWLAIRATLREDLPF
jgi:hypothetical protein